MKALLLVLSIGLSTSQWVTAQSDPESPIREFASVSRAEPSPSRFDGQSQAEIPKIAAVTAPLAASPMRYSATTSINTPAKELSDHRMALIQSTPEHGDKFSLDNLLDGVVYDFRNANEKRVEFGGPGIGDWELTRVDEKYDVPFIMLLLFSSKF